MKLIGKGKNPKPSEIWNFLKLLAKKGGEISWENIKDLPRKDINTIKKHKQLLSEFLQFYFTIDLDPFFPYDEYPPYKHEKSYKIRMGLIPTQKMIDKTQLFIKEMEEEIDSKDEEKDDLGIKEYYKQQTPEVYDKYQ